MPRSGVRYGVSLEIELHSQGESGEDATQAAMLTYGNTLKLRRPIRRGVRDNK
jgi:hypothetical protein